MFLRVFHFSPCVQGCVSQVWVVPDVRDGKIYWRADSDAQLTKGLAALLVKGLSGCAPEEIVNVEADFIEMLGLKQSLTPSRNNGFLNMFRLMQARAHCSLQSLRTPHAWGPMHLHAWSICLGCATTQACCMPCAAAASPW